MLRCFPRQLYFLAFGSWCWHSAVSGFEVFSEQQTLTLNNPSLLVNYNNTEYGSTHVDDYWTKLDYQHSPLEGWTLVRHVRLGCFMVQFGAGTLGSYVQATDPEMSDIDCVSFCNATQAYFQSPFCRCAIREDELFMTEVNAPTCPLQSWEVFREYDYRSSMSPATFDVTRRLVYQIVTMRVPHVEPAIRYYIHAVNAMEAKPKFAFDTRLERMVFNAVWDFGRSRMVALSFEEWGAPLDFTLVAFNTSSGTLAVQQAHFPLSSQISAEGSLVSSGLASADGMGTVDILYGTYYTVVPAMMDSSPQIVHVIVAIDIDTKRVIHAVTLPVTLMNLQINSLQHVLYGAGADLAGEYNYYELCKASNNATDGEGTSVVVDCPFARLSPLPGAVNHMYLQSATIDHHVNYAWFAYKNEATGRPLILEYHQSNADYVLWRQDSLPLEAAFSSLIQTAPRIIFSLYPPAIRWARFSTSGTTIFVEFEAPTLRGAVPIDADGDELPDYWRDEDKLTRTPCDFFLDDFTMRMIPGSMCQWTSDSNMYIEINRQATIMPSDLIRIRGNRLWAGRRTLSGVSLFSQPSTDFAVVGVPLVIPYPVVRVGGNVLIDECTPLVLDGSESTDHGFRGTFLWTLNRTEPAKPEPHVREIGRVLQEIQAGYGRITPQILTIPPGKLEGGTKYFVMLTVFSLWDMNKHTSLNHGVMVSRTPIPPLVIFGASYRTISAENPVRLGALLSFEGCMNASSGTAVTYEFTGCLSSEATDVFEGVVGCPAWNAELYAKAFGSEPRITGEMSRSLFIEPYTLDVQKEYMFSVRATVQTSDGVLQNVASTTIFVELSNLVLRFHGGTGFSAAQNAAIAVDATPSVDPGDPLALLGGPTSFNFSCEVLTSGAPCWSGVSGTILTEISCNLVAEPFMFRGRQYFHSEGTTRGTLLPELKYCMYGGVLLLQPDSLALDTFVIKVNMSKVVGSVHRTEQGSCTVEVVQPGPASQSGENTPQVTVSVQSELPFVPSRALRVVGNVTNPSNKTAYTYKWTLEQYGVNPDYDPDRALTDPLYDVPFYKYSELPSDVFNANDPTNLAMPAGSPFFVVPPDVLAPGMQYRLRLEITDAVLSFRETPDAVGHAYVNLPAYGLPPGGGTLQASALSGTAFSTEFTFSMVGWGSEDLPLTYQFGYIQDFEDEFAYETHLKSIWTVRSFTTTILPPGKVMPGYRLRVIGSVMSSRGAIAKLSVDISVPPPTNPAMRQNVIRMIREMDTETAFTAVTMIVQDASPNSLELEQMLNESIAAGILNFSLVPNSPLTAVRTSQLFQEMCFKGLYTQELLDQVAELANRSSVSNLVEPMLPPSEDLVMPLLSTYDCFLPGVFQASQGQRRLQAAVVDSRSLSMRHSHHLQVRGLVRQLGTELLSHTYPQEAPLSYSLRGYDMFIGKDYSHNEGKLSRHSSVQNSFSIPSLDANRMPPVFTYRYLEYKKFPFIFMALPDNRTLLSPRESQAAADGTSRIPLQGYPTNEPMWHAMTLEITDELGGRFEDLVSTSLENATFNVLPRVTAHPASSFATYRHAATCYSVNLGQNLTEASYDPKGIVYSDDACVTKRLPDFAVLLDDLGLELEQMEVSAGDFLGSYLEGFRSLAMVGMLVSTLIIALALAACAFYVDTIEPDEKEAIDDLKKLVIERSDQREQLVETLLFTFKRDHLLVGAWTKHRRVTREKRVEIMLFAWLATEAVTTVMNARLRFKAEKHFIAIGLVAGVLIFPITQFVEFLFDWCPQTRGKVAFSPLTSLPAKPIPLKQQVTVPHLHKPKKPGLPPHIVPPAPGAPLRTGGTITAPALPQSVPLELPALQPGDHSLRIEPPPRQQRQAPRPPKEPPPAQHLIASRPHSSSHGLKALKGPGPFGLSLPELPPLPVSTANTEKGEVPAPPPPKRPGRGPKPPQAPPPLSKMFFAAPQSALPSVPPLTLVPPRKAAMLGEPKQLDAPPPSAPVPPLKAAVLGGPKLPPIPKLMRPYEVMGLGLVKIGGRDASSHVPPPPPPPKEVLRHFPAPPQTPRQRTPELPLPSLPQDAPTPVAGSVGSMLIDVLPQASISGPQAPLPPQEQSGDLPGAIAEAEAPLQAPPALREEPSHGMMRPLRTDAVTPPPPPPPRLSGGGVPRPPPAFPQPPSALPKPASALPQPPPGMPSLPPFRAVPGRPTPPPKHLPLQLPSTALMKVPAIRPHEGGEEMLPPPPPPPPRLTLPGWNREAKPPEEREPPSMQQLVAYKPPSLSSKPLPKPPPKPPPSAAQKPRPPSGPAPAHAIILAKKGAMSGEEEDELSRRMKPPPLLPKLPEGLAPAFVRRNVVPEDDVFNKRDVFREGEKRGRARPLSVVPDWVLHASFWAVQCFVAGFILGCCFFIIYWGVHLESHEQWATHAASVVGCVINFGVFESLKCVVIACVNLMHMESLKRQEELDARRLRMQLKAQRLGEKKAKRRRKVQLRPGPASPALERSLRIRT